MGTLTANGQTLAVTKATVAADFHEALHVLGNFAVQVALNREVLLDVIAELAEILFGEVLHADVRVHTGFRKDLLGGREANAVDVGQADFNALIARKVDTNETCHRLIPLLSS